MGLFQWISRLFKGEASPSAAFAGGPSEPAPVSIEPKGGAHSPATRAALKAEVGVSRPARTDDAHDIHLDDDEELEGLDLSAATNNELAPAPPRNKQELLRQLQQNYAEVVHLVRKVDAHLDVQDTRSQRLLVATERIAAAMESMPELRDQNRALVDAVTELVTVTRDEATRTDQRQEAQVKALNAVRVLVGEQNEQGRQLDQTVAGFGSTIERFGDTVGGLHGAMGDMSGATDKLGVVLDELHRRNDKREKQLTDMIEDSHRWMVALVSLCAVGFIGAIVVGVLVLTGGV